MGQVDGTIPILFPYCGKHCSLVAFTDPERDAHGGFVLLSFAMEPGFICVKKKKKKGMLICSLGDWANQQGQHPHEFPFLKTSLL